MTKNERYLVNRVKEVAASVSDSLFRTLREGDTDTRHSGYSPDNETLNFSISGPRRPDGSYGPVEASATIKLSDLIDYGFERQMKSEEVPSGLKLTNYSGN